MLACDKCGAAITEGSKFCPQCGDPVTEKDKMMKPSTKNQIAMVKISFGKSSSPNYQQAIDICKNIPTYSVEGEGKQISHSIELPITEVELLINLYELVGNWKSSKMLINGQRKTKKSLTYYGVGCYRKRQKAYNPKQYCFGENNFDANIWGCKRLKMPIYEWGGGWLSYGEFDKSGIWHFDKDRIEHDLELAIKENELCPILNRNRILKTLQNLPNKINPKNNEIWEFKTSYEEIDGDYKEVAVGIKPKIEKIDKFVSGDFKPNFELEGNTTEQKMKISIGADKNRSQNVNSTTKTVKNSGGCLLPIIIFIITIVLLLSLLIIV